MVQILCCQSESVFADINFNVLFQWLKSPQNSRFALIPATLPCAYILFFFLENSKLLLLWQSPKMKWPRTTELAQKCNLCLPWERAQKQGKTLDTQHTTYHSQQKLSALFLQHSKLCWKLNEKLLVFQILYIEKWYTVWNIASQIKSSPRLQLYTTTVTNEI